MTEWQAKAYADQSAYRALVEACGLRVERLEVEHKRWDFKTHEGFVHFAEATFVEWTRKIPAAERKAFIDEVLARYRRLDGAPAAQAHTFFFDQMRIELRR